MFMVPCKREIEIAVVETGFVICDKPRLVGAPWGGEKVYTVQTPREVSELVLRLLTEEDKTDESITDFLEGDRRPHNPPVTGDDEERTGVHPLSELYSTTHRLD